ncbi:Transcriptional regulatory protein TdiR [Phycisphaerae bacterium RAS1]|nr:Transcriptional regulatory protein TdiR [Phycisphaerae bacterium RAS1]
MSSQQHNYSVFVVDDDAEMRSSLVWMFAGLGITAVAFSSAEEFLASYDSGARGCALVDVRMPGMSGLELQQQLAERGCRLPVIVMSGHADVPSAVEAMEAGAVSYVEKPFRQDDILRVIDRALHRADQIARHDADQSVLQRLSPREYEVMQLAVHGEPSKAIAHRLGISKRTVDKHRGRILAKTGAETWAGLIALCLRVDMDGWSSPSDAGAHHVP